MTAADADTVVALVLREDLARLARAAEIENALLRAYAMARTGASNAPTAAGRTFFRLEMQRLMREMGCPDE